MDCFEQNVPYAYPDNSYISENQLLLWTIHFFWVVETKVPGSTSGCSIGSSMNGIYSQFIHQMTMNAYFVDNY